MKIKRIISLVLAASMLIAGLIFPGCNEQRGERQADVNSPVPTELAEQNSQEPSELPTEDAMPASTVPGTSGKTVSVVKAVAPFADYPQDPDSVRRTEYGSAEEKKKWSKMQEEWKAADDARKAAAEDFMGMSKFGSAIISESVKHAGENNMVMSPVSIYMALAMLAEATGGETRKEILDALDIESMGKLRDNCLSLMKAESVDDGVTKGVFANSLWINDGIEFNDKTLETIAEYYFASSYAGDPASKSFAKAMKEWLNEQTGGLLNESIDSIDIDPNLLIAVSSTVYIKAKWEEKFNWDKTKKGIFHAASGDIECPLMHDSFNTYYFKGDDFAAISLSLKNESGEVWFLLPDEGVTIEKMLENGGLDFLLSDKTGGYDECRVNVVMPRLDISSDNDIIETLKSIGVVSCFSSEADFTPLSSVGASVSQANQAARFKADEYGMEAAAYSVAYATYGGSYKPENDVDFIADRPFVFCVKGVSDAPLFVGVVNTPIN